VRAYHVLWSAAGIDPETTSLPEDLHRLPIVAKCDLQQFSVTERSWPGIAHNGTRTRHRLSGAPFEVLLDRATRRRRARRFFKALLDCGYRPGQRLFLLSKRNRTGPGRFLNWRYAPLALGTSELAAIYLAFRPAVLCGPTGALLRLAEELATGTQDDWHRPRIVISTTEGLTETSKHQLRESFKVEPADFHGMPETGLLAWRRGEQSHYQLAEREFLFEFFPSADPVLERVVITDLDRSAMPLVRFDTGELARRDRSEAKPRVIAFENDVHRPQGQRSREEHELQGS
jgi:phenylacetate-coenzyme A ligase PaaK-like adenylate-forming protein